MHGFAMVGLGTRRILVSTACLCGSRHSLATRREPGWGMPAEASDEERMLLHQPDGEVVNFPHMADACDESAKLAERDSLLGIDYCCEGAAICGVRTERSLGQRRQDSSGRSVEVAIVGRHVCIRGVWCRRSSLGTRDYSNSRSLIRWGVRLGRAPMRLGAWSMLPGRPLLKTGFGLLVHWAVLR